MKTPGFPLFVALGLALLGGGVVIGHYALPSRERRSLSETGGGPASAGVLPVLTSPLAGLAASTTAVAPFKGSAADLRKEARAAGDSSGAQLRLTLLLAQTPASEIARLAKEIVWKRSGPWEDQMVQTIVLERWAETDPEAALAWTYSHPDALGKGFRGQILSRWARADKDKALKYARGLKDTMEREAAVADIASAVAGSDPKEALRILQSAGSSHGRNYTYSIFSTWASDDPSSAAAAALRLSSKNERSSALSSVFSTWAKSDPEAASEAALALIDAGLRAQALRSVLGAWTQSDPEAAYGLARSLPAGQERSNALKAIIQQWSENDPTRALAVFDTLSRKEKENSYYYLARGLAQSDPAAAVAWAKSLPGQNMAPNALSNVLGEWARADGPAAAAAAAALPVHLRSNALSNTLSHWASNDPDAALQWARTLENPKDRWLALSQCVGHLDLSDPAQIDSLLGEFPMGEARFNFLARIASTRVESDPAGTLAWLRSLPDADRARLMQDGALRTIAASDPSGVAALLLENPDATGNNDSTWGATARAMAETDPWAALAWAESIPVPGTRESTLQAVLQSWVGTDPDAALAYAGGLADPEAKSRAVGTVFEQWARDSPDTLLAYAATAEGEERGLALVNAAVQFANFDAGTGAAALAPLLAEQGGDDPSGALRNAVNRIAGGWGLENPAAACAWAATLPAGSLQNSAIGSIVSGWTRHDPMGASAWISGLPSGEARDGAVKSLVNIISRSDPESAFAWAASIGEASSRESSLRNTLSNWQGIDPDAARAAVEQAQLPDALRAELLGSFPAAR